MLWGIAYLFLFLQCVFVFFFFLVQVCDREGRARHAREALRSPGFSRHGGALDEAARFLPEAETDQQPSGPVRTRRCLVISAISSCQCLWMQRELQGCTWCKNHVGLDVVAQCETVFIADAYDVNAQNYCYFRAKK